MRGAHLDYEDAGKRIRPSNGVLSGVYTALYFWRFGGFRFRMGYHGLEEYYDDFETRDDPVMD